MPPWKPLPNPAPAIAEPAKNTAAEPRLTASTVTATPVIRAAMPASITVRAAARRSAMIATTAEPASTNRLRLPSTTLPEPVSACTSAGPSAPYSPASAHTANSTGTAVSTGPRSARGRVISGRRLASAPGAGLTVSRIATIAAACRASTPIRAR